MSTIFAVVGATGQQGGATARALLARGVTVRALTRDPSSAAAQHLAADGATVVKADTADPASLRAAFAGVDGVFAMTTVPRSGRYEGETEDGRALADAARDAGVPVFVYSSVGGAERQTGIPHFDSKWRVEEYVATLGLPAVIVRPTYFMDNLFRVAPPVEDGTLVLRMPLPADVPLQMIASVDVGAVAAAILLEPARVPSGAVEIAGDELTGPEMAAALGRRFGVPARYEALPVEVMDGVGDQRAMYEWFARLPAYQADLTLTRALDPDVCDYDTWLAGIEYTPAVAHA